MSKDRPAGMDNLTLSRRKPQTDKTKMGTVSKTAGGKIDGNKVSGVKGARGNFGTSKRGR